LTYSPANTVVNNTCNSNTEYGIGLVYSQNNTVANNICNNNRIGIYLYDSPQNTVTNNTFFNNTERAIYFYDSRIKAVAPLLVGLVGIIALAIVRGPGWRRHYREYLQAWRAWQLEDKTRREAYDEEIRRWGADQEARLKEEKRRIASEKSSEDDIDIPRMRIAGQVVDLRFWLKTSIKVSLLLLTPVWAFLECEASLALSDYGGNYNCMLFTMFAPQFSEEIFINIRGLDTILAAIIICVPGIYFTRRLAHQPKTTPIKDLALASGFATSFVAMYCVYGNSLSYDLLTMGSMALVLFVFLPIFVREAELVGLAKVLRERQGNEDIKRSWVQRQTMPRRYALVGNALALFAFLSPYYVLVETRVLEVPYQILYQYQVFSALVGTTYQNRAGGIFWIVGAPYWSFGNAIFGMDLLFNVLFFMGARFLYAFGILRYWRGKTSSRKVVLAGAIGILLPAIILQSVQVSLVSGTLVFSSPLPILFLGGLLAIGMIQPKDYENMDSVELTSEVDIPLFYTLRSRVALVVSRLRRREADTESESEKQAS
ncbi:MAG: NosD domain-containing protein, partial [Promethearchaeota archaeon]